MRLEGLGLEMEVLVVRVLLDTLIRIYQVLFALDKKRIFALIHGLRN